MTRHEFHRALRDCAARAASDTDTADLYVRRDRSHAALETPYIVTAADGTEYRALVSVRMWRCIWAPRHTT